MPVCRVLPIRRAALVVEKSRSAPATPLEALVHHSCSFTKSANVLFLPYLSMRDRREDDFGRCPDRFQRNPERLSKVTDRITPRACVVPSICFSERVVRRVQDV